MAPTTPPVVSILKRKRDLAYLVYFVIHIVVLFLIDLTPLYPDALNPAVSRALLRYQGEVYQDRFFTEYSAFFAFFRLMEAGLHVPVSFWSLWALVKGDYRLPVVLLAYAVQTCVTTATCMYDYALWTDIDATAKWHLTSLYGPYLLLSALMAVDMYGRLRGSLAELEVLRAGKKKN